MSINLPTVEVRDDFMDRAILKLAKRGPTERWDFESGTPKVESREDRDAWALRVTEDALALVTAREKMLARFEADDAAILGTPGRWVEAYPGELDVLRAEREQYLNADKLIDAERQKVDALDSKLAAAEETIAVTDNMVKEEGAKVATILRRALDLATERQELAAKLAAAERVQGDERAERDELRAKLSEAERERDEARNETRAALNQIDRMCSAPSTVQTVDIKRAAREIGQVFVINSDKVCEILRRHARPADAEALAKEPEPWKPRTGRCDVCDWTLAESRDKGCVPGDCSYRPEQGSPEWYRIKARQEEIERQRAEGGAS